MTTYTTPEAQADALLESLGCEEALKEARAALGYHRVHKQLISSFFWSHTIFILKNRRSHMDAI